MINGCFRIGLLWYNAIEELAVRLDGAFDERFHLLISGVRTAPARQQTLRATLAWSYALLTPAEQRLLAQLAVFNGGWTAVALQKITGATLELLAQLVNKSLVIADQQAGRTRYRLLETVRQFAAEQLVLAAAEQRQVQWQHSRHYLGLLGEQEAPLQSPQQQAGLPAPIFVSRPDWFEVTLQGPGASLPMSQPQPGATIGLPPPPISASDGRLNAAWYNQAWSLR